MKSIFLAATVLASGLVTPAFAQSAEAPAEARDQKIDEIVVTAERRQSTLQKSSLSLQVLSAEDTKAIARPADLNAQVPGIQIGSGGPNPQVYIRGIGDQARNSISQSAVLFNIDGVALVRPSASTTNFFDLQRVEVLKGPQGTLYGRNASGGVINLVTTPPRIGETGGYAIVEVGNYSLKTVEAALNVGLSSAAALRVSGRIVDRDGYLSDGAQDQKTRAARVKLLVQPSDDLSVVLTGDVSHIGGKGSGVTLYPPYKKRPWHSTTDTRDLPFAFIFGPGTAPFTAPNDRKIDGNLWGLSAELTANLGFATLTVIPAHRSHKQYYVSYNANFRFAEDLDSNTDTVEVRLAHESDRLKWLAGLYYFNDNTDVAIYPTQGNFNSALQTATQSKSKAAFFNATLNLAGNLRLLGGIRYTDEESQAVVQNGTGAEPQVAFVPVGAPVTTEAFKADSITWKAGVEYDVSPGSMLYANVSTGFKAGGFNLTPCGKPGYGPEKVTAWLAGSRNRFFGGALQVNGEVFLNKARGSQLTALTDVCNAANTGTTAGFLTFNVGKSTIYGANIDLVWRATANDTLHFAAEYLHTRADDFTFTQRGAGAYGPGLRSRCSATAIGGGLFSIDCDGLPLQRSPKWTVQGDASHRFDLGGGGTLTPKVMGQYSSRRWLDSAYGPNALGPSYFRMNAEATYESSDKVWALTAYVTNLTNARVYTSGTTIGVIDPATGLRRVTANIEPPRMFGARLRVNY